MSKNQADINKVISAASSLAGYASSISEIGTRKVPECWIAGLQRYIKSYENAAMNYYEELEDKP